MKITVTTKKDRGRLWKRFYSRERFHGNVVLNFTQFPKQELAVYGRSYHEAGQRLVRHLASSHYRDPDACPVVFLYRHTIEFYLKSIIHWGNALLRLNRKPVVHHSKIFTEHRLTVLLRNVRPILRFRRSLSNWGDPQFRCFRDVEKVIAELEEIDPRSYAFRYPIDTAGKKAPLPHHLVFNVVTFGEKFDHLVNMLDSISLMLYEDFQSQAEAHYEVHQMLANSPER